MLASKVTVWLVKGTRGRSLAGYLGSAAAAFLSVFPAAPVEAQTCQAPGSSSQGEQYGKNPGYDLLTIRPCAFQPMVAGLEFLPGGDLLVLTWRGSTGPRGNSGDVPTVSTYNLNARTGTTKPRTIYRLSSAVKGRDNAAVTFKEVADQAWFKDPQGLVRVGDDIYVGDVDRIVKLNDANGDGVYEGVTKVGDLPNGQGWFEYGFGPVHKDGYLYMSQAVGVLATGWPVKQLVADNGSVLRVPLAGGKYEVVSEGLRAPDGIGIGPDGEVFITDNQGSFKPGNRIDHIRPGKWFGFMTDPAGPLQTAANGAWTRPAIWGVYNDIDQSMTEPWTLRTGPFKGHMVIGDNSEGGVMRAYLEKVNGEYQGGLTAFCGGLEGPVHRIREDDQGHLYLGMVGNGGDGNQGWASRIMGLQKVIRNANPAFEIYAAYSRAGGMEIEFTHAVGAAAAEAAKYAVRHWKNEPQLQYGGGHRTGTASLAVGTPQLCPGGKRVFLPLTGLTADRTVHINVNGVQSADGKALWFKDTWYTLNAISATKACADPVVSARETGAPAGFRLERSGDRELRVILPDGAHDLELAGADGKVLQAWQGKRGALTLRLDEAGTGASAGIRFLRVKGMGRSWVRALPI